MSNSDYIKEIRVRKERLERRAQRLEAGEELCDHHWNGSDRCYETYCTGCKRHTGEIYDKDCIPFKKDNICYTCRKTPEEKEAEIKLAAFHQEQSERKKIDELLLK